jgi:heme/copper-type cytochrome/quinol oxidase subunit 2
MPSLIKREATIDPFFLQFPEEFRGMEKEVRRRQQLYPHMSAEEVFNTMADLTSYDGMRMELALMDLEDSLGTDYSNMINYEGTLVDVSKLPQEEVVYLASVIDDITKFESLEHVKSLYMTTAPNVKLYYPEPFIASPSFIHNDIGYIHILQYQFWLWFLFIFLVCFFFISFICVVRWCTNRVQPRRETRGVSRSKCGDLITATVPVTWAISIIVSESTDATDYYDGFGTGELVIGVRAYQWGWHYYYPKSIDINYNVKPNYSSFVGNSLKYTSSTSKKLNTNSLWKFYQTKIDDTAISPAHVLVLPSDNSKVLNLMNFKDLGIDTLQASKAFKQIRASARIYTTNLNHNPSFFANKYNRINNLFFNENNLSVSNSFGIKRQHNLTSSAATTAIHSTFLDKKSLDKFLSYNLQYNIRQSETNLFNNSADLWLKDGQKVVKVPSNNAIRLLLQNSYRRNTRALRLLSNYPNITKNFGDNTDKKSKIYPFRRISGGKFWRKTNSKFTNKGSLNNSTFPKKSSSLTGTYFNTHLRNLPTTSKDFMISYKFSIMDPNYRFQNLYINTNPRQTNMNLSSSVNSVDSNLKRSYLNSNYTSPLGSYISQKSNWVDSTTFNKLSSNRPVYDSISPILSTNPLNSRSNFSRLYSTTIKSYYNSNGSVKRWHNIQEDSNTVDKVKSPSDTSKSLLTSPVKDPYIDLVNSFKREDINLEVQTWGRRYFKASKIFVNDKSSEIAPLTAPYWKMFFANTNPNIRLNHLLQDYSLQSNSQLTNFVNYYDYNFDNAQSLKFFEDIVWESAYSGYSHANYLKVFKKYREFEDFRYYRWDFNNTNLLSLDRDAEVSCRFGTDAKVRAPKNMGKFYSNNIQTDDYFLPVHLLNNKDFNELPVMVNSLSMEESYRNSKNLNNLLLSKSSIPLGVYNTRNYPQSSHGVLNNFRSDFEDFSHFKDNPLKLKVSLLSSKDFSSTEPLKLLKKNIRFSSVKPSTNSMEAPLVGKELVDNTSLRDTQSRFSNPITLRRSAKSSIVTHQAYQKVFKLRYEEGRAHVRLTDFANSSISQPFTTEQKVRYERMLGKSRLSHFNTNYNINSTLKVFNPFASLSNSLNFYFYEFPFLDGVTNDPSRHVWFDVFVKYAQREVSGSSVSKYTIAGVPFFKKKFDFNIIKGRQLADTDLYFTRIKVSRKNYLPVWLYTPYLYTRSKVWYNDTMSKLLSPSKAKSLLSVKRTLRRSSWYLNKGSFSKSTSLQFTPSFSQTYKCTHRPYTSIQGYQYSIKTLTDILSKREYIYRQTLERRSKIFELPNSLRATPKHPLINDIKSAFLLIDPITYNSEYSREFFYSSMSYFKFLIFKDFLIHLGQTLDHLPINLKLVNQYLFFHFVSQQNANSMGNREDLLKSQYKPLKRGISNMMRLQGSGAVAMPIEIRLQILASSKDVIHSWAIPSAGIKIDCIPGYSSHRIMIFFTPGIYWGQCMEICGRYHHWMPIIIYFMKRDLFFLWCTHFLSKKDPYATKYWEANDRQFADYLNFVSYNKSSWLTELKHDL